MYKPHATITTWQTTYTRERWGRGRTRQLLRRVRCLFAGGHRWAPMTIDESGAISTRCVRDCGALLIERHIRISTHA